MLLFLDESYEADELGGYRLAYAGFAIDERKYRGLVAAVYQAKQRFIGQIDPDMDDAQRIEAGRSKLLQGMPPERAEIKANKLMGSRQVKRLAERGFAPGIALAGDMLHALQSLEGTVFGVLSEPSTIQDVLDPKDQLPEELVRLLERVEAWMREQHHDEMVAVIPDALEHFKHNMSACFADFLFRSSQGKSMRHIVVTPLWVDSSVTVGSQLADIVAYLLLNTMRPKDKQLALVDLWRTAASMEFHSIDGSTRGIRRIRKRKSQQAGDETR